MSARAALALLFGAAAACAGASPGRTVAVSDGRYVMGTVLELTLHASDRDAAQATLGELFALAERLDALLTTYDPESEISRLNRSAGRATQRLDPDVRDLLERSRLYAHLTGGAFDVTVGPLVALWRSAEERGERPSSATLAQARRRVGSERIRIGASGVALDEGVTVDLGGIAKGYALDRMLPLLRERGIARALLNFGQSSTWAVGAPPGAAGWRLLVRGPGAGFLGLVTLRDQALSVSGSLGQWVEIGGERYGHIVDPRTGEPRRSRRQALVVARGAALAEALSTALLVLGEEEGLALVAAQPDCEALLLDAGGGVWMTSGWREATRFEPLAP